MSLKKLAESFNYLSGIKDLSIMKGDLNEEINLTPEQDKELLNIILKYASSILKLSKLPKQLYI